MKKRKILIFSEVWQRNFSGGLAKTGHSVGPQKEIRNLLKGEPQIKDGLKKIAPAAQLVDHSIRCTGPTNLEGLAELTRGISRTRNLLLLKPWRD